MLETRFNDVPFMSALDKEKVLKAFKRFVKSGFAWTSFSKALYEHLYLHCGFIAHYDRNGFWDYHFYYFSRSGEWNDERFQEFLIAFIDREAEYKFGDRFCVRSRIGGTGAAISSYNRDYLDINLAMSDVVKERLENRFNKSVPVKEASGYQGSLFDLKVA
jgi:hypothetical protein